MQAVEAHGLGPATSLYRRVRAILEKPYVITLLFLIIVLGFLVLLPLIRLIVESFVWSGADERLVGPQAVLGAFTSFHWTRVFTGPLSLPAFYVPLLHSVITSAGAAVIALSVGVSLAWLVVRSDIPYRTLIGSFGVVPFLMPSWVLANAWIIFLKNRAIGGTIGVFAYFTGTEPPDWIAYGPLPIMLTLGIHYSALPFLITSAGLATVDVQLEEAGELLGASRARILSSITFPIIIPAIFSALILVFTRALGNFGTPYFLGAPVGYQLISTRLYGNVTNGMFGDAWVIATVLILSSILLVVYSSRYSRQGERYQTVSGKSPMQRQSPLGFWRIPSFCLVLGLIFLIVVIPVILFAWESLMKEAGNFSFANMTLHYWIGKSDPNIADGEPGILRQPIILSALWNTLRLGLLSALVGSFLGILLGYGVVKGKRSVLALLADQLSFVPYLMPSIAIGAVYVSMFGKSWGPIPALYGTFTLLVLGMLVKNLPFASRTGISTMLQIGSDLEEAAYVLGSSWIHTFRKVIAPLAMGGFVVGFVLTLVIAMKELDLVILLTSPGNDVLSTAALALSAQGVPQLGSATIFLQLVCIYVTLIVTTRIFGVDIAKGMR